MAPAGRILLFILALLLAGCSASPSTPWQIEVAGCETWVSGPACAIGKEKLRFWVAGEESFKVELDGQALVLLPRPVAGGHRFELQIPSNAQQLRLVRKGGKTFELALTESRRVAWYGQLRAALADPEKAVELLAQKPEQTAEERAWKRYFEARIAFRGGEYLAAVGPATRSAELWSSPLPGYAINELVFGAQMLAYEARFGESRQKLAQAERLLDSMQSWDFRPWQSVFLVNHQKTSLAIETGDVRGALAHWEKLAAFVPHEILSLDERISIESLHIRILAELGRFAEALAILEQLQQLPSLSQEQRARLANDSGWLALLAQLAEQPAKDPRPFLAEAWTYYGSHGSGLDQLTVLLNQGTAEMLAGRLPQAREFLAAAKSRLDVATAGEHFDFKELEAQLLQAEGKTQAAFELFHQLDVEASRQGLPGSRWRALVGKAQAEAAAGRRQAAIETFERAELLESQELLAIPIDKGRETFLARRVPVTGRHLELLLAQEQFTKAHELARRHRTQTLRLLHRYELLASAAPDRHHRWDRAAEEYRRRMNELEKEAEPGTQAAPRESRRVDPQLTRSGAELGAIFDAALADLGLPPAASPIPAPRPGELTLSFFPLGTSWLLFAADSAGHLRVATREGRDLAAVAGELLGGVLPEIEDSSRLKILPWGDLDFHSLLVDGEPLLARRPIVYGVDVGSGVEAPLPRSQSRVLLVGNPQLDLRTTPREIDMAGRVLAQEGFVIGSTLLGHAADAPTVRAELERADYFHFAGHSYFDVKAGSQSRISLYGGELKASDIFTLRKVPAQVLLSSCSAGQARHAAGVEGLGLAQAFILAGSRQVLATTREVDDREAAGLIDAFYRHLFAAGQEGRAPDLAAALQLAQLERRESRKDSDWQAFRVFEP